MDIHQIERDVLELLHDNEGRATPMNMDELSHKIAQACGITRAMAQGIIIGMEGDGKVKLFVHPPA